MKTIEFERLSPGPDARVLDVGCGEGRHAVAAAIEGVDTVVGVDVDLDRLHAARDDCAEYVPADAATAFLRGDGCRLPFRDGSFDLVVCSEVLEHVPRYGRALDELARVCRPGGSLAVSVPRSGPERICWALSEEYHEVEGGHVRIFDRSALRGAVESRGFRCVDDHYAHALHSPYWWLKCLWWDRRDEDQPAPLRAYERFLEWDILNEPAPVRRLEELLDPVLGKSVVLYFERQGQA